jgi:hypothetical protein
MKLTEEQINSFQALYRQTFGVDLPFELTLEYAQKLITIIKSSIPN